MGVSGLTSFIDSHPRLLKDYCLHDTRLIIDGNNLYHFLYYYYHVRHECAGDYDVFHVSCQAFFSALHKCGVIPYVVFDGAHHEDNRKFKTSLRRANERLHLAGFLSVGNRAKILPILAYETFRDVLNEMGVAHVTCFLEADEEIGALAQRWKCPVLTNDSDFFVYDLPSGIVPLDYINVTVVDIGRRELGASKEKPEKQYCLRGQIYFLDGLLRLLKYRDREMIALAATLIGNDVVGRHNFETFYAKARIVNLNPGAQGSKTPGSAVASIFDWLSSADGVADAIDQVLKCIPESRRDFVSDLIQKSIVSYTKLESSIHEYFENEYCSVTTASSSLVLPTSFGCREIPGWFLDGIRSSSIPVRALSALTRRRVILLAQVEVMTEPSAYDCSQRLRSCLYSTLLTVDQSAAEAAPLVVQEHSRKEKNIKCCPILFLDRFAKGVPVPDLKLIPSLDREERLMLLTCALSPSFNASQAKQELMQHLPEGVCLLVLTIVHWTLHANPKVSDLHVKSLLVCCVCLGGLDDWIPSEAEKLTVQRNLGTTNPKDCAVNSVKNSVLAELERVKMELTLKYSNAPRVNNASAFDGRIVHAFCQYQTCLQGTIHLSQILGLPSFSALRPALTYNGTFLYNLMQELQSRTNPDLFIEQLLGRDSSISAKLKQLYLIICTIQPSDTLLSAVETKRVHSKKTKARSKDNRVEGTGVADAQVEGDDFVDKVSYDVDITNKFSCLDLDLKSGLDE